MSGAITLGTIAAIGSAAVGAGSLAYGIVQGQSANEQQQVALKKQTTAQQTAQSAALSNERQSATAQSAANMKTPDITSILKRAATTGTGASSTMLTGAKGVPGTGNLGGATLLGS